MPKVNQVSVIGTVTRLGNGQPKKCGSISCRGRRHFFFSKTFRLAVGLKQPVIFVGTGASFHRGKAA